MSSNVGNAQVYEAGDQRNPPESEKPKAEPYHEGKANAHDQQDPKDERSIANKLAAAKPQNDEAGSSGKASAEDKLAQQDATAPARAHGNEPSKGAKIDAEIQAEEEALLAKKDAAKSAKGKKN